jgi:hypothetical protein
MATVLEMGTAREGFTQNFPDSLIAQYMRLSFMM